MLVYIIISVAFLLFTVWCLRPRLCRKCHNGHYRQMLMDFSPVFVSRCDNCGHWEASDAL